MPLTSPDLVRAHLSGLRLSETPIHNEEIVLTGSTAIPLAHTGIKIGSAVVKSHRDGPPIREFVTLDDNWVALAHSPLVVQSVLIASDTSLGIVYAENTDYVVDTKAGRIRRLETGGIASGAEVVAWYDYFHVYIEGDDFEINASESTIRRISGGAIADGQGVTVDYLLLPGNMPDEVIESAIAEAAEMVIAFADPRFHESPTPGLVIGETHWAVAALCRMRAAQVLSESAPGVQSTAEAWISLGAQYDQSGRRHLSRYARPLPARHSPRIA